VSDAERRPSPRRRLAAALALTLGAATLAGAFATVLADPMAGLLALAGLAGALWLVWRGVVRRGWMRALYLGAASLTTGGMLGMLAARELVSELIVVGSGALLCVAAVKRAFAPHGSAGGGWRRAPPLRQPVLLINPRSGGRKAERLGIADEARARGVKPLVLEPGDDLATVARGAIDGGADALGMAGGDGSLAIVAALAAERDLPFVCIPAGTRNHLALDVGVNRRDPVGALDAFIQGVERRIDLADVNGRTFVNNVSLGVYGRAVHRQAYRGGKLRTLLGVLPDVIGPRAPPSPVRLTDDLGRLRTDASVIVVSNNPYASDRVLGGGTRPRLDCGRLGIVVIGRPGGEGLRAWSAPAFRVAAAGPIRAGADGEAVLLEPPIRFAIRPSALRVRISARHPGVSPSALLPRRARSTLPKLARMAIGREADR
jgi:diacylglycerol kinase family enzyme